LPIGSSSGKYFSASFSVRTIERGCVRALLELPLIKENEKTVKRELSAHIPCLSINFLPDFVDNSVSG